MRIDTNQSKFDEQSPEPAPTPKKAAKPKAKPAPAPKKSKPSTESPRGVKRKAAAPVKKVVKKKKTVVSDDESEEALSEAPSDPEEASPKKSIRRTKVVAEDSEEEDDIPKSKAKPGKQEESDEEPPVAKKANAIPDDVSESEMSSLIDESPKKKKSKAPEKKAVKGSKGKDPKAAKPRVKATKDEGPDEAEIKRLQSWLVKCGIRKVWSKELSKCDTSREKIKHLKAMLSDAGMEGKYSNEKAAKIKEDREFAKDLEDIQMGEQSWGQAADSGTGGRPRRRAAQAAKPIVIQRQIDSDDDDVEDDQDESEDDSSVNDADSGKDDSDGSGGSDSDIVDDSD